MRLVVLAIGVVALGQSAVAWAQGGSESPKVVVDGYGEVKTMPNIATIGYTLRGEGSTSDDAVRAMTATGTGVEAALQSLDPAVEPKTEEVRVSPVKGSNCKDRDYESDDQLSKGQCAIVGYIASQSVKIRTANVKDAGTMFGLAGRGGAYNSRVSDFALSDPRSAKGQAISVALLDAHTKAAAIAAGIRLTLGPILTVSTVGREIIRTEDLVNSLPQSFAANRTSPTPVTVKLTPEPITTSATVTVTYGIGR